MEVPIQFYKFTIADASLSMPTCTSLVHENPIAAVISWIVDEKTNMRLKISLSALNRKDLDIDFSSSLKKIRNSANTSPHKSFSYPIILKIC